MKSPLDLPMPDLARRAALLAMLPAGVLGGCSRLETAPAFNYTLLDGTPASSQGLRGRVTLVNFWATTCAVCVQEMPQIVATHLKFAGRAFDTLAVSMQYDPPAAVSNFAQRHRLPFGVAIDNTGTIAKAFGGVQGTPTTFVFGKRGAMARRWVGAPDFGELQTLVERLLAEPA